MSGLHEFVESASGRCRQASTTLPSIAAVTRSMSTGSRTTIGRRPPLSRALLARVPASAGRGLQGRGHRSRGKDWDQMRAVFGRCMDSELSPSAVIVTCSAANLPGCCVTSFCALQGLSPDGMAASLAAPYPGTHRRDRGSGVASAQEYLATSSRSCAGRGKCWFVFNLLSKQKLCHDGGNLIFVAPARHALEAFTQPGFVPKLPAFLIKMPAQTGAVRMGSNAPTCQAEFDLRI